MELKFVEQGTIMDVQAYHNVVGLDNSYKNFLCKYIEIYKENLILISCQDMAEDISSLKDGCILVFNFFRGAFGYEFSGRVAETSLHEGNVVIQVLSTVEKYSRRKSPRVEIITPVNIFAAAEEGEPKGMFISTESTLDISNGGISIVTNNDEINIQKGKAYVLEFLLHKQTFTIFARLVHSGDCQKLFTYKYVHAFEFRYYTDYERLANAIFNHKLMGH